MFSAVVLMICAKIDLFFEKLDKDFCVFRSQFCLVVGLRTGWWRRCSSGEDFASKIVQVVAFLVEIGVRVAVDCGKRHCLDRSFYFGYERRRYTLINLFL